MSMENEQKQQPTYEELAQAYSNVLRALEQAQREIETLRSDNLVNRLQILMQIFEHKDNYPNKVLKLAEWHLEKLLAKPE